MTNCTFDQLHLVTRRLLHQEYDLAPATPGPRAPLVLGGDAEGEEEPPSGGPPTAAAAGLEGRGRQEGGSKALMRGCVVGTGNGAVAGRGGVRAGGRGGEGVRAGDGGTLGAAA